jgi:DNA-binding CsgD family transcriptional regulator
MATDLDVIGSIEAAYASDGSDEEWLERLARCVGPAFGAGVAPVTAYSFDLVASEYLGRFASVGSPGFTREQFQAMQGTATPAELRAAYECDMFTLLSRVVGRERTSTSIENGRMGELELDPLGLRANATPDSGVVITTVVPGGYRIRHRPLWVRLAAHIGAGFRLRRLRHTPPEGAAAVLTPSGRLEHATPATEAARAELADAAQAMDRARGKLRRLDPDEASSIWRAMVCGEWSIAEWFDHDGKRFLIAHENRVAADAPPQLTSREWQAVACAAMGHSNKLIGYDLGLSTGTVSVLLRRAAEKMGASSRTALICAFRERRPTRAAEPAS